MIDKELLLIFFFFVSNLEQDKKILPNFIKLSQKFAENCLLFLFLNFLAPPPPLVNVTIVPSTILALILWDVQGTGGYPIIDFTAQYRLADNTNDTWLPISPNHIPPNCVRPPLLFLPINFVLIETMQITETDRRL